MFIQIVLEPLVPNLSEPKKYFREFLKVCVVVRGHGGREASVAHGQLLYAGGAAAVQVE